MTPHFTSAKVIGTPNPSGWVQVHEFHPDNPEKLAKGGRIYALILKEGSNSSSDAIAYVRDAREILTRLHEEYYGKIDDNAFVTLKNAVEKVTQEWSGSENKVSIGALVFLEDVVYGAVSGDISLLLGREGALIPLINDAYSETKSVSGVPRLRDTFVLVTRNFQKLVPMGILKAGITSGDPSGFTESIAPQVYSSTDNSKTGLLVVSLFEDAPSFVTPVIHKDQHVPIKEVKNLSKGFLVKGIDSLLSIIPERGITIRNEPLGVGRSKKKMAPLIGLLLVVLLFLSISVGVRERNRKASRLEFETELTQAQHEFSEAKTLTALNPERARELALSARKRAIALKDKGVKDQKLTEFLSTLSTEMGTITGVYEFEPELYLDLTLVSSGFVGTDMAYSEGSISVLDSKARKLVGIELPTKRTSILAGPDFLLSPESLSQYTNRSFVLSRDGVRRVDDEVELVIKEQWDTSALLLNAFAGNIYIVDKNENTVWRYPAAGSGYGTRSNWLATGITTDLSEATDIAIDGSIWVYSGSDGRIRKFTQGVPQTFSPSSYLSLSGMTDFFTSEESQHLYFLDAAHSKIIVVTKEGTYKAEYVSDKIKEGIRVIVSEEEKKMIILTGEKLFVLPINHL